MVKSKAGIEKYVNLLGVTYTLCITLPFIDNRFAKYMFQSPQEFKYSLFSLHKTIDRLNLLFLSK